MVSSRFKMCVIFTISRLELLFPVRRIISLIFSGQNGSMIYVQSSASIMDESLSWGFVLAIMLSQALLMGGYKDMSEEEKLVLSRCRTATMWFSCRRMPYFLLRMTIPAFRRFESVRHGGFSFIQK